MSPVSPGSPTSRMLQLCLLALASAPGAASAQVMTRDRYNEIPRCTPQAPSSGIHLSAPTVSDIGMSGPVSDLSVSGGSRLWAVGSGGQIRHHPYNGAPWSVIESNTTHNLRAVSTEPHLPLSWFVGDQGTVLRYGATGLTPVTSPTRADLLDVLFWGETQGAIVGNDGAFFLTMDGGESWIRPGRPGSTAAITQLAASPPSPIPSVFALRADGAVLVARPKAHREDTDWSLDAHAVPGSLLPLRDLFVWSDSSLAVVDSAGTVWATSDGGDSWLPSTPLPSSSRRVTAPDPLIAIETTPIGVVGVQQSGHLITVSPTAGAAQLTPLVLSPMYAELDRLPELPEPPPGLILTRAFSAQQGEGLLGLTADGQLMEQRIQIWFQPGHPCGRPFEVAQQSRCAPPVHDTGWSAAPEDDADVQRLPQATRARLAAAWLRDAQAEHASVASFARFALRLLALGAPAELLAEAQQAMGDEIRHARHGFALASRYAGTPLAPGPLAIDGALDGPADLHAVAVEVLREGAVGETIGALLAAEMRARAQDPRVRDALTEIAADEARHAQMAWRFLRWAVDQGGEPLREHLRAALPDALHAWRTPPPAAEEAEDAALWARHGRLSPHEEHRIIRRCLRQVIRPCLDQLLPPAASRPAEAQG